MSVALMRSLVTWRKSEPKAMAEQSQAALVFAFSDAKHDIALLATQRDDLLVALQGLLTVLVEWHNDFPEFVGDKEKPVLAAAYAAIAKATGEPK